MLATDRAAGRALVIVQVVALELETVRVAEPALVIVRVVAELGHDPVVAEELEHGPAAEEREHGLAVAELAPVQVAVLVGTKSVTTAHRRGLPLLVPEDLAVAVETTLVPVAAEAATAWGVADSAAVAAVVAAAGDKRSMRKNK